MPFPFKKVIWKASLGLIFAAPFIFFSSSIKPYIGSNLIFSGLNEIIAFPERLWTMTDQSITRVLQRYVLLRHVELENEDLKRQLSTLKMKQADYQERVAEAKRLRELLGFNERFERNLVASEVISGFSHTGFEALRIDRGSQDGVQIGMPVVAPDGIVGRIIRTGFHYSDVQLVVDGNFNMDVLIQRTRVRGVLEGIAGDKCRLQLHRRSDVRIGDTVITSGIVGGFPKGLPVGKVVRISYELDNVSQVIYIEPWIDFRRLEEVAVLKLPPMELEKITEIAGKNWIENAIPQTSSGS